MQVTPKRVLVVGQTADGQTLYFTHDYRVLDALIWAEQRAWRGIGKHVWVLPEQVAYPSTVQPTKSTDATSKTDGQIEVTPTSVVVEGRGEDGKVVYFTAHPYLVNGIAWSLRKKGIRRIPIEVAAGQLVPLPHTLLS